MPGGHRWNPKGNLNPAWIDSPVKDPAWFRQKYVDENMSLRSVAKEAGCALRTAARWREIHAIPARPSGVRLRSYAGEANPNFKGDLRRRLWRYARGRIQNWGWAALQLQRVPQCEACGSGDRLHAHHIRGLHSVLDDVADVETYEEGTEVLKFHPDLIGEQAGVTLCKPCHDRLHQGPWRDRYPLELLTEADDVRVSSDD